MARILLVDPDSTVRLVARGLLQDAGHEVVEVADGKAAQRTLAEDRFDLVITELHMDVVDGLELIRAMSEAHPGVPALVMTSDTGPMGLRILKMAELLGAAGLLDKPSLDRDLIRAVNAILAA